jgi:uncharacterized protein (TIGR00251 family)
VEERLKVCVKPNAPVSEVVGYEDDCLVVKVAAPPQGGKANRELVKLLKKYFKAKKVEIVKGHTSRVKIVVVEK